MKLLFQFISHKNGTRSEVLEMTRDQLAREILRTQVIHKDDFEVLCSANNDYVLVLMEKPDGPNEEYSFSLAPLFICADFLAATLDKTQQDAFTLEIEKLSDEKLQEQYA